MSIQLTKIKVTIKRFITRFMGKYCPKLLVSILYKRKFGKRLNWNNPQTLNEKIQWLKFNTDISSWSLLADKYRVREYVKQRGCEEILVKLYGVWENPSLIEWDKLPSQFVMKSNSGCGDVLICKDKASIVQANWGGYFLKIIHKKYGYESGETHYAAIKPVILAEELLDASKQVIVLSSLIDYKVWCFNGKPYSILVCSNRTHDALDLSCYDLDWNFHPENIRSGSHYKRASQALPRPKALDKMLEYARKLSVELPQVRVDFYEVDGKVYFGEMTMTSCGGLMEYYTDEYLLEMGNQIEL